MRQNNLISSLRGIYVRMNMNFALNESFRFCFDLDYDFTGETNGITVLLLSTTPRITEEYLTLGKTKDTNWTENLIFRVLGPRF